MLYVKPLTYENCTIDQNDKSIYFQSYWRLYAWLSDTPAYVNLRPYGQYIYKEASANRSKSGLNVARRKRMSECAG